MADNSTIIPWSNLVPIPDGYKEVGCRIQDTHLRGVTIEILEDLLELIEKVLKAGYKIKDPYRGNQEISLEEINLYHIDEHFVKPLTQQFECSFAELASPPPPRNKDEVEGERSLPPPLPPLFFVSHWWGTPLVDTIRMLKLHRRECFDEIKAGEWNKHSWNKSSRWLKDDSIYTVWICAFANNQHHICEELTCATGVVGANSYLQTPFARAILAPQCRGTVLLLNEGDATPFTRSWCIFEAFVSLTIAQKTKGSYQQFDILTIIPQGSCVTYRKNDDDEKNPRCAGLLQDPNANDTRAKQADYFVQFLTDTNNSNDNDPDTIGAEAWFPTDVALLGLEVDVQKAKATQEMDQRNISYWVGDQYNEVNLALRERFVRPALKAACMEFNAEKLRRIEIDSRILIDKTELIRTINGLEMVLQTLLAEPQLAEASKKQEISEFLKALLALGIDPNRPLLGRVGLDGKRPLGLALRQEQYDLARILLEAGAEPRQLRTVDLMGIDYSKCPEDIYETLGNDGIVCKGRCRRAFRPLFSGWFACYRCIFKWNPCCVVCWICCLYTTAFCKDFQAYDSDDGGTDDGDDSSERLKEMNEVRLDLAGFANQQGPLTKCIQKEKENLKSLG